MHSPNFIGFNHIRLGYENNFCQYNTEKKMYSSYTDCNKSTFYFYFFFQNTYFFRKHNNMKKEILWLESKVFYLDALDVILHCIGG